MGNYVGSFTDGYKNGISGATNFTSQDKTITIYTGFENIDTSLIYLNIKIPTTLEDYYLKCIISGNDNLIMSNKGNMTILNTLDNGKLKLIINSPTYAVGTGIDGEIRLI